MARSLSARPIRDVAGDLDLAPAQLIPFGFDKAKITLDALESGGPASAIHAPAERADCALGAPGVI